MKFKFVKSIGQECGKCCFILRSLNCFQHPCHHKERSDRKDGYWTVVPNSRKVAKVEVYNYVGIYWKIDSINGVNIHCNGDYKTHEAAIRGARRFCKSIGYECEIVKGGGK